MYASRACTFMKIFTSLTEHAFIVTLPIYEYIKTAICNISFILNCWMDARKSYWFSTTYFRKNIQRSRVKYHTLRVFLAEAYKFDADVIISGMFTFGLVLSIAWNYAENIILSFPFKRNELSRFIKKTLITCLTLNNKTMSYGPTHRIFYPPNSASCVCGGQHKAKCSTLVAFLWITWKKTIGYENMTEGFSLEE